MEREKKKRKKKQKKQEKGGGMGTGKHERGGMNKHDKRGVDRTTIAMTHMTHKSSHINNISLNPMTHLLASNHQLESIEVRQVGAELLGLELVGPCRLLPCSLSAGLGPCSGDGGAAVRGKESRRGHPSRSPKQNPPQPTRATTHTRPKPKA